MPDLKCFILGWFLSTFSADVVYLSSGVVVRLIFRRDDNNNLLEVQTKHHCWSLNVSKVRLPFSFLHGTVSAPSAKIRSRWSVTGVQSFGDERHQVVLNMTRAALRLRQWVAVTGWWKSSGPSSCCWAVAVMNGAVNNERFESLFRRNLATFR